MSILALGRKALTKRKARLEEFKYPGVRAAMDGSTAVIMCERESTDAAGAYPITPSTQMGEFWAEAAAAGHLNISGRPLIFIEPEGACAQPTSHRVRESPTCTSPSTPPSESA